MKKKRLGTWWQKLSTLCRGSDTSCEMGKTGVEQLKHCRVHKIRAHSQLNDTQWSNWYRILLFLTCMFNSWLWLPQNTTDLKHWSRSTSNIWMFLSKANNFELCFFLLPKIKLVLGSSAPRFAPEKTSASSILVFLDIFFCYQAEMDTSIGQSIPHIFHTFYRNVKYGHYTMLDQDFVHCTLLAPKLHSKILFCLGCSFEKDLILAAFKFI